jgi:hypothetical protein
MADSKTKRVELKLEDGSYINTNFDNIGQESEARA